MLNMKKLNLNILLLIALFGADPGRSSRGKRNNRTTMNIASTSTHIDERLSTAENLTILAGETAMLACKIYNLGNKSVSQFSNLKVQMFSIFMFR